MLRPKVPMKCSYFTRNIFFLIALPIIACITPRLIDVHLE